MSLDVMSLILMNFLNTHIAKLLKTLSKT